MNIPVFGSPMDGGFYAGRISIDDQEFNLIVAPKAEGDYDDAVWIENYKEVPGAKSSFDGLSNTNAMVKAGSELAKWARDLRINGYDDWYLPAQDELEILYRAFKPSTETNSQYARSGINLSTIPPTYPYTPEFPDQSSAEAFKKDGEQAFVDTWYWSSTQHASYSECAWGQDFHNGNQDDYFTGYTLRARAVRRSLI